MDVTETIFGFGNKMRSIPKGIAFLTGLFKKKIENYTLPEKTSKTF